MLECAIISRTKLASEIGGLVYSLVIGYVWVCEAEWLAKCMRRTWTVAYMLTCQFTT